jgi:hypothetical protein
MREYGLTKKGLPIKEGLKGYIIKNNILLLLIHLIYVSGTPNIGMSAQGPGPGCLPCSRRTPDH